MSLNIFNLTCNITQNANLVGDGNHIFNLRKINIASKTGIYYLLKDKKQVANIMPRKYTDERKKDLLTKLVTYIQQTECPIIKAFAVANNIDSRVLYTWKGESDVEVFYEDGENSDIFTFDIALQKSRDKAEVYYQTAGKKENVVFSIFALKARAGWRDQAIPEAPKAPTIHVHNYSDMNPTQLEGGIQDRLLRLKENNTAKKGKKSA